MVKQLVLVAPHPASPLSTIATLQPRPDEDPFEAPMSSTLEHAESDTPLVATLSMEHVDAGSVPHSEASEMAGELLGNLWSNVGLPAPLPVVLNPAESLPRTSDGAFPTTSRASQDAHPSVSPETVSRNVLYQTLGYHIVQSLREALDAHLPTMLTQLMPHLLETVRDVVQAKMPDL